MRRLLTYAIVAALAWYGWGKYHERSAAIAEEAALVDTSDSPDLDSSFSPEPERAPLSEAEHVTFPEPEGTSAPAAPTFSCDGRTYCSQMRSCAEATYFIRNCPGTKMDGNNDGVPCEKQWCN